MGVLTGILTWAITLGCFYVAYVAVREVEQVAVRRPFSLLLTLVLVVATAGLLLGGLSPVMNTLLDQNAYGDLGDRWLGLLGGALVVAAIAVIWRDVARRMRRGVCAQCSTPLLGHTVCPACGWGGLGLLSQVLGRTRRVAPMGAHSPAVPDTGAPAMSGGASTASSNDPLLAPYGGAPTVRSGDTSTVRSGDTSTVRSAAPATGSGTAPYVGAPTVRAATQSVEPATGPAATAAARFCARCGMAIPAGSSFCPRCGAPTT